ncbi:hypothetical protein TTHERM_01298540 (macronuclear) [Tetrahymena thermophila SB210]|uniref:Uncharacterized protein n=1 Tax=Tetrahymena thermophila (strain SB210) TaxID=312017 RepID=Q22A11_TETTS|nr:hypothetical protein TTHERM_01298540 [Tetrahymena thermophila SB210]EAR82131.2 hypothetical protein TTHERM_01298540 [Tetrahymena thermophila SB210]|eukprot:XP_001029794.2 hypothetical protein TTHERM_01298540 [Tetrahymena thermophila SB210]
MSTDDLNILLRSNDQINEIMRNKNKFVITRLNNQHLYSMRKNYQEKKKNLLPQQEQNFQNKQQNISNNNQLLNARSLQILKPLDFNKSTQNSKTNKQTSQKKDNGQKYALELGTPSALYTSNLTIQQMLETAGHDVSTKNQLVNVEKNLSNALQKRTFYNCNRGMGLFEPKISQFNPRTEIHRIKLRTNDPLALLLHYTVNQSMISDQNQRQPANSQQINSSQQTINSQLKKKQFSDKESIKFLEEVLRQGYIQGLSRAVFQNETILQDEQIEKTFQIENELYNQYLNQKKEIQHQQKQNYNLFQTQTNIQQINSGIQLPRINQSQPNINNTFKKNKEDSIFLGHEDESFIQKINLQKKPKKRSFHLEDQKDRL